MEASIIQVLTQAVSNEELVIFVGAGVSRLRGGPSWEDLSKDYLKYLYEKGAINYATYLYLKKENSRKLMTICEQIQTSSNIEPFHMADVFKNERNNPPLNLDEYKDIFEILYSIGGIFVTTNYDDYLDQVAIKAFLNQKDKPSNPSSLPIIYHYKDIDSTSNLKKGYVIHIHGSINDPNEQRKQVRTTSDYFEAYSRDSRLPSFLDAVFEKIVLFIGYGLEEYEVLEFILNKTNKANKAKGRTYMLYGVLKEEKEFFKLQKKYYEELGIVLIEFPLSKVGYGQLYTEIKKISKQIGHKARPKRDLDKFKLVDEIL